MEHILSKVYLNSKYTNPARGILDYRRKNGPKDQLSFALEFKLAISYIS